MEKTLGRHRLKTVQLVAGRTYTIRTVSHAFNPYLFVQLPDMPSPSNALADKTGTNGEAIITLTATQSGAYWVISNTQFGHQQGMYYSEIYE